MKRRPPLITTTTATTTTRTTVAPPVDAAQSLEAKIDTVTKDILGHKGLKRHFWIET